MSAEKAAELGLKPRARFTNFALAGTDPVTMLKGPIPVTEKIMDKAEITLDDIDLFEINEAFASVVLAWQKERVSPSTRSMSTAAPSPSAIRWAARAPSS